jgi:hypothetical protein
LDHILAAVATFIGRRGGQDNLKNIGIIENEPTVFIPTPSKETKIISALKL